MLADDVKILSECDNLVELKSSRNLAWCEAYQWDMSINVKKRLPIVLACEEWPGRLKLLSLETKIVWDAKSKKT